MPNPNDGTQLGTSEIISDEYIDPVLGSRRDPNQQPGPYKLPRSKIAIGPYGQDLGDAANDSPLPVESRAERQALEHQSLVVRYEAAQMMTRYSTETVSLVDSRGHHLTNRGTR